MEAARRARVVADEEALPFGDGSLDLVVSALALQFVNDLPGTLVQIRRALKPDGLFLAALLGGDTLTELRQAFAAAEAEIEGGISPRVAPFADVRDLGALLQRAGFALPVTDVDRLTVRYASPFALMHDLRRMGATNALLERRRTPLRRATLMRMAEIYAERFADRRRPHPRDVRDRLAVGLGAACEPAAAAQARLGARRGSPMRSAPGDVGRGEGGRLSEPRTSPLGAALNVAHGRRRGSKPSRRSRRQCRKRSGRIRSRWRRCSSRDEAARSNAKCRLSLDFLDMALPDSFCRSSQQRRQVRRSAARRQAASDSPAAGSAAPRRAPGLPARVTVPSQRRQT